MRVVESAAELHNILKEFLNTGKKIGFVPTMGALHEGHLSLIERSINENDITVCSIFINPKQFNNSGDLQNYPRTFNADKSLLESVDCDILFYPSYKEVYPDESDIPVEIGELATLYEGSFRQGHFDGVTTVVNRFFEIVQPHKAYFGLKDYQQYAVIKQMAKLLESPVEVIGCQTKRSKEGLALSSRNQLLSDEEKNSALIFYQCLELAKTLIISLSIQEIKEEVESRFKVINNCRLEYFEIADAENLMPLHDLTTKPSAVALIAGYIGDVRLIDNLILIP